MFRSFLHATEIDLKKKNILKNYFKDNRNLVKKIASCTWLFIFNGVQIENKPCLEIKEKTKIKNCSRSGVLLSAVAIHKMTSVLCPETFLLYTTDTEIIPFKERLHLVHSRLFIPIGRYRIIALNFIFSIVLQSK